MKWFSCLSEIPNNQFDYMDMVEAARCKFQMQADMIRALETAKSFSVQLVDGPCLIGKSVRRRGLTAKFQALDPALKDPVNGECTSLVSAVFRLHQNTDLTVVKIRTWDDDVIVKCIETVTIDSL